mgnify:CR=1 FL=1
MTFQINPNNPFTNMIPAKMELRRLFRVSFILENGIAIEISDHTSPAPINIKGLEGSPCRAILIKEDERK